MNMNTRIFNVYNNFKKSMTNKTLKRPWSQPRRKFLGIHLYRMPFALHINLFDDEEYVGVTWEEWERRIKLVCPIQFWIRHKLFPFIKYWFQFFEWNYNADGETKHFGWNYENKIIRKLIDWKIEIINDNLKPYNVVKIATLGKHYTDECELLLHAPMQILTDYVERQMKYPSSYYADPKGYVPDPDEGEIWLNAHKEIYEIYSWWKNYKSRVKEYEDKSDKLYKSYKRKDITSQLWSDEIHRIDKEFELEKETMLCRLAKIRLFIWD